MDSNTSRGAEQIRDSPFAAEDRVLLVSQVLAPEERRLTVANYLEFVSDGGFDLPSNTITPSEEQGMPLAQERMLRMYAAILIR